MRRHIWLVARARRFATLTPPLVDVRCFDPSASSESARAAAAAAASSACRQHGLLALPAYGGITPSTVHDAFASVRAGTRSFNTERGAALLFYGPPGTGKSTLPTDQTQGPLHPSRRLCG